MSDLKPCPFCGGEAKAFQHGDTGYVVQCRRCGIWNAGYHAAWSHITEDEFNGFIDEESAIAAWNARAEWTCELSYQTGKDNPMRGWWLCDQCGGMTDSVGGGWDGRRQRTRPPAYCARCGARNEVGE